MSRTFVPEEEKKATDTTDLADNVRPTSNRVVQVENDADSEPNFFYWDPSGAATNSDGTTAIASNITEFADGGANEGLWRRLILPVPTASIADLSDVSSLSTSSGEVLAGNGSGSVTSQTISTITSGNVALTDLSDVGTDTDTRAELPDLPSIATTTSPSKDSDLATKVYVDGVAEGLDVKDSVRVATDGSNVDLGSATDPNPIDGVTLSDGDRVLLKDQTTASENGVYDAVTATDPTTWTRSADFDEDAEVTAGAFTFTEEGTTNANSGFVLTTTDPITVGTDSLAFSQFSDAGQVSAGDGLSKTGSTLSVNVSDFAGSGLQDDGSDNLQLVNDSVTVTSGDGLKNGGSVALGSSITLDIEPTDFAGKFLSDDGSDNLDVGISNGLADDQSGSIELDLGVSDNGGDVSTSTSIYDLNFGSGLDITDNTGTTPGRVTIDVNAGSSTSIDVDDSSSDVATGVNSLNFGTNLSVTDDGGSAVTIDGTDTNTTEIDVDDSGGDIATGVNNLDFDQSLQALDGGSGLASINGPINGNDLILDDEAGYEWGQASFNNTTFDLGALGQSVIDTPQGFVFNDDGTRLFITDSGQNSGSDIIRQFNLSTAYDITTASDSGNTISDSSLADVPLSVTFNHDGTKIFVSGTDGVLREFSLGTAYDLGSTVTVGPTFDISTDISSGVPSGFEFNPSGETLYVLISADQNVLEYSLSTGYDLSTPTTGPDSTTDISGNTNNPNGTNFNDDGRKFYISDSGSQDILEYELSTPYDVTTLTFDKSFDVSNESEGSVVDVDFNGDGSLGFVLDGPNDINEYDTSESPARFRIDVPSIIEQTLAGGSNISLTFDTRTQELTIDGTDTNTTDLDIDDSSSDVATGVDNIDFGTALSVTDNGSGKVTVNGTNISGQEDGGQVLADVETINVSTGLGTSVNSNTLTITNDTRWGSQTFSANGSTTSFNIPHGQGSTPSAWTVEPTTDDASGYSHTTADSTNITVEFDTAPPSGSNNITFNYALDV